MNGIKLTISKSKQIISESPDKCVICQANENIPTASHDTGKRRILEVSTLRKDDIYQRLNKFGANFCYHTGNLCYKTYTHKKNTINLNSQEPTSDADAALYEPKNTARESKCAVCNHITRNNKFQKYRITDSLRAEKFLKAKMHFQDDVNIRMSNFVCVGDILSGSVFCHKDCIKTYLRRYDETTKENNENVTPQGGQKRTFILNYFDSLLPQLKDGIGIDLSEIRSNIKILYDSDVTNRYIKKCILEKFGEEIRFSNSSSANKSAMVFHSSVSVEQVIDFLRYKYGVKGFAQDLRRLFKNFDFELKDEFCDATNIKHAWQKMKIPPLILEFYAELFKFDVEEFEKTSELIDENTSEDIENSSNKFLSKCLKVRSVFQIMHYVINNGAQKTPLHVMNGLAVHDTCRGSNLIKSLNHTGLSISYDEVLRCRNDLARYTITTKKDHVPIPSHFDINMFTTAAFDNFDHNEATFTGLGSSHDTVSVLFQDKPNVDLKKPKLSEAGMKHGGKIYREELDCQQIKEFHKPPKTIKLPQDYVVSEEEFSSASDICAVVKKKEFAWEFCRLNPQLQQSEERKNVKQMVPTWGAFNSFVSGEKKRPTQIVGFIPLIAKPVTEYATVNTALHNFKNVCHQLKQSHLPVTCDEGVYKIARHIMLLRPNEFSELILMMGPFHLAKIIFACIGKYLKNSGAELIFIESGVFGPAVTESVMKGTNYVRSLKGFILLSETLRRLQIKEFLKGHELSNYKDEVVKLNELQQCFAEKNLSQCKQKLDEYMQLPGKIQIDFDKFINLRRSESELFKYWDNVINIISIVKDVVRADREGDWLLHLATLGKSLPIFAVFDRPNYFRWASIYFEDMKKLQTTAPEIHEHFMDGKFSIKRSPRPFTAVGADMGLEQSINKSKKSTNGVIGNTRNKAFATEWELVYHEVLAVSNLHREITRVNTSNYELRHHHEFTNSEIQEMEKHIESMQNFILKNENPFGAGSKKLKNIITQVEVNESFKKQILDVVGIGEKMYSEFRTNRFINKTEMISSVIHNSKVPLFSTQVKRTESDLNPSKKCISGLRIIDLARERQYNIAKLFTFELVNNEFLFDENGHLSKVNKDLLTELEKKVKKTMLAETKEKLPEITYEVQEKDECCCIINVMSEIKKVSTVHIKSFGDLVHSFFDFIIRVIPQTTTRIDFIFDSIMEESPKSYVRYLEASNGSIRINKIEKDTPLPVKMSLFWASYENGIKLQKFIKSFISDSFKFASNQNIYCSAMIVETDEDVSEHCESFVLLNGSVLNTTHYDLEYSHLEEGHLRIMPHIADAAKSGYLQVIILSDVEDVIPISLFHWSIFQEYGLKELWLRIGSESTVRQVPLHTWGGVLGTEQCDALVAVHTLTGCRYTSKFGTRNAALNNNASIVYLKSFGHITHNDTTAFEESVASAERFLIKVLKKKSECKSLDELRKWCYSFGNVSSLDKLPPTSRSAREHILRAIYYAHTILTCLNDNVKEKLDPEKFGYIMSNGTVKPRKNIILYPSEDDLVPSCTCGKCGNKSICVCYLAGIPCCSFCKCHSVENIICKNSYSDNVPPTPMSNKRALDEEVPSSITSGHKKLKK